MQRSPGQLRCLVFTGGFGLRNGTTYGPFSETLLEMARRGHVFHVVCSTHLVEGSPPRIEGPGEVVVHTIDSATLAAKAVAPLRRIVLGLHLIKKHELGLTYVHILVVWGLVASLLRGLTGVPLVYWTCSDWPPEARSSEPLRTRLMLRFGLRHVIRRSARTVTCTQYALGAANATARVGVSRFRIIPNAVNFDRFDRAAVERASTRQHLGLGDAPLVVYVSQLSPRKGATDLLEAVPRVLERVPEARFLFIGGGPSEDDLRRVTDERKLTEAVQFLGAVGTDEVPRYLAAGDVFCVPSRYEGFGRVFAEAMSVGLPIVTTTAGGIPEVVADGVVGSLVPPGNPPQLATALVDLLLDRDRRNIMSTAARERARSLYDQPVVAEAFISVLSEVASPG